ncbi:MAG: hypothetical protein KC636_34885 [Myxococcales bacterium]|nr:hypothetical protein [Myxococcales bacterium]
MLEGTVRRAGDRSLLAAVTVLLIPASANARPGPTQPPASGEQPAWTLRTETDANGRFVFPDVPGERAHLILLVGGHHRLDRIVRISSDPRRQVYFLRPEEQDAYRTVVRARAPGSEATVVRRELTREEIETVPGSQGDPLRGLQNMPGFLRAPGGLGAVVIRGAPPWQSQVFYGEHPIPRAFHLYSLASSLPAPVIDRIDYTPGNFTSRRGNATGGLVELTPRSPGRDGVHGYGDVAITGFGASVEGPLAEGAFLTAARMGFFDIVNAVRASLAEGSVSTFGYFDYQAAVEQPLPRGLELTVRALGSGDHWAAPQLPFEAVRQAWFRDHFHRFDLALRRRRGPTSLLIAPAFRYDYTNHFEGYTTESRHDLNTLLRIEVDHKITPGASILIGADGQWTPVRFDEETYDGERHLRGVETSTGFYVEPRLSRGPLTVWPSARFNVFTADSNVVASVDPRLRASLEIGEGWELRAGVGLYSRAARTVAAFNPVGFDPRYLIENASIEIPPAFWSIIGTDFNFAPDPQALALERAAQVSGALSYAIDDAWSIDLTGYWVRVAHTPIVALDQDEIETLSEHRVGLELWLRRRLVKGLYGWVAYSLLHAVDRSEQLSGATAINPGSYDQRHNLNLALSYQLPRGWRLGGRFRLSSGLPFTPFRGTIQVGGHTPGERPGYILLGETNSERYPWFHQLDLRVDRTWILKRARISAYLDILNVYNAENIEVYAYSMDLRRVGVPGLPILPVIGLHITY